MHILSMGNEHSRVLGSGDNAKPCGPSDSRTAHIHARLGKQRISDGAAGPPTNSTDPYSTPHPLGYKGNRVKKRLINPPMAVAMTTAPTKIEAPTAKPSSFSKTNTDAMQGTKSVIVITATKV